MHFEYPVETDEGNQYVITFCLFEKDIVDVDLHVDVYFVVLEAINIRETINSFNSLMVIARTILDFLLRHDVVLFYYCDIEDSIMNRVNPKRKLTLITPQQYRSLLFFKLFERIRSIDESLNLENKTIKFEELDVPHYMHLVSRGKNFDNFDDMELDIHRLATQMK